MSIPCLPRPIRCRGTAQGGTVRHATGHQHGLRLRCATVERLIGAYWRAHSRPAANIQTMAPFLDAEQAGSRRNGHAYSMPDISSEGP